MKLFMKIYGGFLSVCFAVFVVLFFLALFVGTLYIIIMPWKPLPVSAEQVATMDLEAKIFTSALGGILLFATLGAIYGILDTYVNPTPSPFSPPRPITPTRNPKKEDKPRPPILG